MKTNKKLVRDFLENNLSKEDQSVFFDALKSGSLQNDLSEAFDKDLASGRSFIEEFNDYSSETVYESIKRRIVNYYNFRRVLKIAASVLIPLLIINGGIWFYFNQRVEWKEVYVAKGKSVELLLPDSSLVSLKSETYFAYRPDFEGTERLVKLNGEGYFKVSKSMQKPFRVATKHLSINVTGTSFNVNAYNSAANNVIRLDEGKVSILLPNGKSINLIPVQEALFDTLTGGITVETILKDTVVVEKQTPKEVVRRVILGENGTTLYSYISTRSNGKWVPLRGTMRLDGNNIITLIDATNKENSYKFRMSNVVRDTLYLKEDLRLINYSCNLVRLDDKKDKKRYILKFTHQSDTNINTISLYEANSTTPRFLIRLKEEN